VILESSFPDFRMVCIPTHGLFASLPHFHPPCVCYTSLDRVASILHRHAYFVSTTAALRETYERQCRSSGSRSYFASAVQHEPATALQSQSTVVVQVPASQQPTATPSPALAADRPRTSALSTVPLRREEKPQRQVQRPSVSLPRPALTSNPAKTGSKRSKAMVGSRIKCLNSLSLQSRCHGTDLRHEATVAGGRCRAQ
jgi:hypothetical protein